MSRSENSPRLAVIVLWAPIDGEGCYGDIFDNPFEAEREAARLGQKVAHGYAVIDLDTGSLPPEASDWHWCLDAAVDELERLISGEFNPDVTTL